MNIIDKVKGNHEQVISDFNSIKESVESVGVTVEEGTPTSGYGALVLDVYGAGKEAERDAFWDIYQQNGTRTLWIYGFYGDGWTDETYKPKYPITTSGAFGQMYGYCNITDTLIPLKFKYHASTQVFRDSTIKNIPSITVEHGQTFSNWFVNCYDLENVTFVDCEIEQNISFSHSKKLTKSCLLHILEKLADKTQDTSGTEWVCTLGTDNLNKLSEAEIAVATGKGWSLA